MTLTFLYRNNLTHSLLLSLFLSVLLAGCSQQARVPDHWAKGDYSPAIDYLDETLQMELDIGDIVGISIALVDDQQLVWQQGFGYSDLDQEQYTDEHSHYRAGALTQLLTATAIMQLVEAGAVRLDQPLQEILPEFKMKTRFEDSAPITLRNLLSHHAGLPSDLLGRRDLAFNKLLPTLQAMSVSFPPNEVVATSNLAYSLLGQVIEAVSGQSYQDYIAEHIFTPLAMVNSSLPVHFSGGAYRGGSAVQEPPLRDVPAAGLVTTVSDLAQLAKWTHRSGSELLQGDNFDELLRVQNTAQLLDLGNQVGLGWRYLERILPRSQPVVGQIAGTYAHRAILLTSLKDKFSVIIMANTAEAEDSLKLIATEAMQYGLAAKNGIYPEFYAKRKLLRANPNKPSQQQLNQQLLGDYASLAGLVQVQQTKSHVLKMNTLGMTLDLVLGSEGESEGSVRPEYRLMGLMSVSLGDYSVMDIYPQRIQGRNLLIGDIEGEKILLGEKISLDEKIIQSDSSVALKAFWGRWYPTEPAATVVVQIAGIEIHEQEGYLTSSLSTNSGTTLHYPLQVLNDSSAVAMGIGQQLGEYFQFYYEAGEPRLNYSGLVFKLSEKK